MFTTDTLLTVNSYFKEQWKIFLPIGDNIRPYPTAYRETNVTSSLSQLKHFWANTRRRFISSSYSGRRQHISGNKKLWVLCGWNCRWYRHCQCYDTFDLVGLLGMACPSKRVVRVWACVVVVFFTIELSPYFASCWCVIIILVIQIVGPTCDPVKWLFKAQMFILLISLQSCRTEVQIRQDKLTKLLYLDHTLD